MKLTHHVPIRALSKVPESDPISERYMQELEASERKARRAWQAAQRRLVAAETRAQHEPTESLFCERDRLRLEVLARLAELRDIEELMRPIVGGANWSGRGSVRAVKKGSV